MRKTENAEPENIIGIDKLREIQLDILSAVDKFCELKGIKYWIDCGTLLGAVRHYGYIPWDDDIDIGMLREDYDRFIKYFNDPSGKYSLKHPEKDKNYGYAFAKVVDTETVMYEPDINGMKGAVYIDVFAYDNAPDNTDLLEKQFKTRDILNKLSIYRNGMYTKNGNIFLKKIFSKLLHIFPANFFPKLIIRNAKKYATYNTTKIGHFSGFTKMACDKNAVSETIDISFEDRKFKAPKGYDSWLKSLYGNTYLELPPVDERVSKHRFIAYCKPKS